MKIVSALLVLPAAAIWVGLFIVQPILAVVVLLSVIAWRDRERRLPKTRPPD